MKHTPISILARRRLAISAGLLAGALSGTALAATLVLPVTATAERSLQAAGLLLDATHLPPLLTTPGEDVTLRYDIHCVPAQESLGSGSELCSGRGSVFIRAGDTGPFTELQLRVDPAAEEGRYAAHVPGEIARSRWGFTYYAMLSAGPGGPTVRLPEAGADAPQRSLPMDRAVEVRLGTHVFGAVHHAHARVAQAPWGDGPADVGLEGGRAFPPIGGSSFDVDAGGTVHVLDHVHRRLLRWQHGTHAPQSVPLAIAGTLADVSIARDGTTYVLEGARASQGPLLRAFDDEGKALGAAELTERTVSQVRLGADGPIVLQQPSGQWVPVTVGRGPQPDAVAVAEGIPGRSLPGGGEVVVLRRGNEVRVAITTAGRVLRSWRVASATPLGEVQLAEPLGTRLVLVVRLYTDTRDEFRVLVLGPAGLEASASLDSADWAESAPLSRFRLVGSSLYQLGSTPTGLFVDRFDLEVTS